jgi:hypothetical protein
MYQKTRTHNGRQRIKKHGKDIIHRDQTQVCKFKFDGMQTKGDGHDGGGDTPTNQVEQRILVCKEIRVPDGVDV